MFLLMALVRIKDFRLEPTNLALVLNTMTTSVFFSTRATKEKKVFVDSVKQCGIMGVGSPLIPIYQAASPALDSFSVNHSEGFAAVIQRALLFSNLN